MELGPAAKKAAGLFFGVGNEAKQVCPDRQNLPPSGKMDGLYNHN